MNLRTRPSYLVLSLCLSLFGLCNSAHGTLSGGITIDANNVLGEISSYLYGNNIQWTEDGDGVYEVTVQADDTGGDSGPVTSGTVATR